MSFDTKRVAKELSDFGRYVVKQSRAMLSKGKHKSSGNLYSSLQFNQRVMKNSFSASFVMADYGDFVDQGVRGAGGVRKTTSKYNRSNNKGKMWKQKGGQSLFSFKNKKPPVSAFMKYASNKSMAFAIRESVFRQGLKPTLFFTKPFEDAFLRLPDDIIEKFGLDVDEFLDQVTKGTDTKVN